MKMKNFPKHKTGFSLVELMISLITISCIAAAFTPVITKKLKKQDVALSLAQTSEIKSPCPEFGEYCELCTLKYCIKCGLTSCNSNEYIDMQNCSCQSCTTIDPNCIECTKDKCTKCASNPAPGYIIKNGKCEACPSNSLPSDGFSTCAKPCSNPGGYVCIDNTLVACNMRYDPHCYNCNQTACTSCQDGFVLSNGSCLDCQGCYSCSSPGVCTSCYGWCTLNSQTKKCETCENIITNCLYCTGDAKNHDNVKCTTCWGGYYVANNGKECRTCDGSDGKGGVDNCITCDSSTGKCIICQKGYYLNSSKVCTKCNKANCAVCSSDGKCSSCERGYYVKNGECVPNDRYFRCSDSNFMQVGKLCITRRNMGDSSILTIPSTVMVVNSGEHCLATEMPCCWKNSTEKASYSEYNTSRTTCNYLAAKEICENYKYAGRKWRLLKANEVDLNPYNYGLRSSGLQLAYQGGGNIANYSDHLGFSYGCVGGVPEKYCHPCEFYLEPINATTGTYWNDMDTYGHVGYDNSLEHGKSVRCVTEIE